MIREKFRRKREKPTDSEGHTLIQKVVETSRVSKKTEGGNRMSFNCLAVVGNGHGKVGSANCRAPDVFSAIQKANNKALKKMITVQLQGEAKTIAHQVEAKKGKAHVIFKPAPKGTGLIVGGVMRSIAEAAGIKNIVGKNLGTKNKKNTIDASLLALQQLKQEKR